MYNPYKVLGVSSLSSKDEIKNKYKQLSKIYHPDNLKTGDNNKFKAINKAWTQIEQSHQEMQRNTQKGVLSYITLFKIRRK